LRTDITRIHHAAVAVLEEIGLSDAPPSGVELLTAAGAVLQGQRPHHFSPRSLWKTSLQAPAATSFFMDRTLAMISNPGGRRCTSGPRGPPSAWSIAATGDYRESTVRDLYDIARIVDAMEHVHFFQRSVVAATSPALRDGLQHLLRRRLGTTKHVGTSWGSRSS
jgi:trimethylamine---corrinoid protein Co-methyltransferase